MRAGPTRTVVALVSGLLALLLAAWWWHDAHRPLAGGDLSQWTPQPSTASSAPSPVEATGTAAGSAAATVGATPAGTAATGGSATPGLAGTATASPSSTTGSGPSATGSAPGASASGTSASGCDATATPIVPTRFQVPGIGVDSPVLSLGLAGDGTVATPPFSQKMSVGWYNGGPRPGSSRGKVVLTAHTFHAGGALGNRLNDPQQGLRPGALVKLSDGAGHTQCYRFTRATKVWVKDYDPNSTVLYDPAGAPQLALVICWDYDGHTWNSRIVFYATPLAH